MPGMKQLGNGEYTNLIVKNFPRPLHVKLRTASVKHDKSIRTITVEAVGLWLKDQNRRSKEKRAKEKLIGKDVAIAISGEPLA